MSDFTAYSVLGGHAGMTQEQLKSLHRLRSNKLHPDRRGGDLLAFTDLQRGWALVRSEEARRNLRLRISAIGDECGVCRGTGFKRIQGKNFQTIAVDPCAKCGGCGYISREK